MDSKHIKKKMLDALMRSGYLLESSVVQNLTKKGFLVEPNQRIADHKTGKTREIDIVAEWWDSNRSHIKNHKLSVLAHFVCEAKNNPNPVVLLTELPSSPNIEVWNSIREGRTGIFEDNFLEPDLGFLNFLVGKEDIYTQYCSFKTKGGGDKEEWMAFHPDDFYDDLEKIVSYCDEQAKLINGLGNDYHRLFLYLPVVILGGDLYVSNPSAKSITLKKVDVARYVHFGIQDDQQTLALVIFVTEHKYEQFFQKIIELGRQFEIETAESLTKSKVSKAKK